MVRHDFATNTGSIGCHYGMDATLVDQYRTRFASINPWLAQEAAYRSPAAVHVGEDLVAPRELVGTEFYAGFLRPQRLLHRMCGILERSGPVVTFFSALRSAESPPFARQDVDLCRHFLPQLQHSLRLGRELSLLRRERDCAWDVLDRFPVGVLILGHDGEVLKINRMARTLLSDRTRRHCPSGAERARRRYIRSMFQRLRAEAEGDRTAVIHLPGHDERGSLLASVRQLAGATATDRPDGWAVLLSDPTVLPAPDEGQIRSLYELTPVEARLSTLIARGRSLEEAAREMRIRRNTARGYLKQIFRKTGAVRQADLVRLLLSCPASLTSAD